MHCVELVQLLLVLVFWARTAVYAVDNTSTTVTAISETTAATIASETAVTALPATFASTDNTCSTNDSTCTNATLAPTTSLPISTTVLPPKIDFKKFESFSNFCTCNLQRKVCEINCCCDNDCSSEDKMVFKECLPERYFRRDTSFCQYMDYMYVNRTPYLWEVDQNGLFCIVKTNLPKQYTVESSKVITSLKEANLQKRNQITWSQLKENVTLPKLFSSNESFVFGSSMWILRNNILQMFQLPDGFVTNACLIKKNMKYLQNFKSKCIQTQLDENNLSLNPTTYTNILFIRAPHYLDASIIEKNFKECPKNICIPIEAKVCDKNYTCFNFSSNYAFSCHSSILTGSNSCFNATQSIKYNVYHNGAKGITKIELFLILKTITHQLKEEKYGFVQQFEVNYFWTNHTLNYSLILSGNPGYLIGKPILIANHVNILFNATNSTTSNQTIVLIKSEIKRNFSDYTDNFLVLPINKHGICILNGQIYLPIEFGYNMITKCKIRGKIEVKNRTAGWICKTIQERIFMFWPVLHANFSDVNKLVASFGNANETIPEDWFKILPNKTPLEILNQTAGNWTNGNTTVLCKHLTARLNIDVFHARFDFGHLVEQEKILATTFLFGAGKSFEFLVSDAKIEFEIEIREEVMFFDKTTTRIKKFVDAPSFKISWPYDFFYPFIKVGSVANKLSHCSHLMLLLFVCLHLCVLF